MRPEKLRAPDPILGKQPAREEPKKDEFFEPQEPRFEPTTLGEYCAKTAQLLERIHQMQGRTVQHTARDKNILSDAEKALITDRSIQNLIINSIAPKIVSPEDHSFYKTRADKKWPAMLDDDHPLSPQKQKEEEEYRRFLDIRNNLITEVLKMLETGATPQGTQDELTLETQKQLADHIAAVKLILKQL